METILVIDDDPIVLGLTQVYLEDQHYNVLVKPDANDLIETCLCVKPNLILLDIWLPNYDVFNLIKMLKAHEETALTAIILISSDNTSNLIGQALDLGADDYVPKPIDFIILHARIRASLRHSKQQIELQKLNNELMAHKIKLEALAKAT